MNKSKPVISIPGNCEFVSAQLAQKLGQAGCQVIRSFDLQRAREVHATCICSYHGTAECDCQMIVLLVYLPIGDLHTLIVHGHGGVSYLSWDEGFTDKENEPIPAILREIYDLFSP